MIKFMVFDPATRRLKPRQLVVSSYELMDLQVEPGEGVVFGHHTPAAHFYADADFEVRPIGDGGPLDPGIPRR